jgi:uncharacterized protein YecE (DUF72 family)
MRRSRERLDTKRQASATCSIIRPVRSRTGEEHPFHQRSAYSPEYLSAVAEVLARDAAAGVETWFIFDNTGGLCRDR